jgi:tetrahydromethanopterin S-methyltransferase subunit D
MILSLCMEMQETDGQQPEEQGIAIYSKLAILVFSIFFSPLIGGILLMLNLRSVGYKKEGTRVLLFAIGYQLISSVAISYVAQMMRIKPNDPAILQNPQIIVGMLILNIVGGGLLAEYFFKKYFPHDDYQHKSIWKALLITILISIPLSMLMRI